MEGVDEDGLLELAKASQHGCVFVDLDDAEQGVLVLERSPTRKDVTTGFVHESKQGTEGSQLA